MDSSSDIVGLGQNTGLECKTSANTAFPDSQDSASSNASPEISLTAYLQQLVNVAQSRPLCPKVDLTEDVTILATKVKERLDEDTMEDVEQDIFNRL